MQDCVKYGPFMIICVVRSLWSDYCKCRTCIYNLVASRNFDDHLQATAEDFSQLRQKGFTFMHEQCAFFLTICFFLLQEEHGSPTSDKILLEINITDKCVRFKEQPNTGDDFALKVYMLPSY